MLLTIIVPTYNCAAFLERAVVSALAFCGDRGEVVVVDDGSTDDTPQLLRRLVESCPNLRAFRTANGGLSHARNFGIDRAVGDYVMLLDADDELLAPPSLSFLQGGHDMVRVGIEEVGIDGQITFHVQTSQTTTGVAYLRMAMGSRTFYTPSCAYIYRRGWMIEQGLHFVDGLLHEDMLFTPSALLQCRSLLVADLVTYRYYRRAGSITHGVDAARVTRRVVSLATICREITTLANRHPDVDLGWWALDIVDYAAEIAAQAPSRSLLWRLFMMELGFFLRCRAWGVHRDRQDVRFRVRQRAERWLRAGRASALSLG